jgi:inositol-phosphate phosphatase/L-galactose 1-phosphate phosphatase/histidinol-phosphatase
MDRCPDDLVAFAHGLADAAAAVQRRWYRNNPPVTIKPDGSPVTVADKESERALRTLLAATYPEHGVVGEEEPPVRADAEWVWVFDPIDGTKDFVAGKPVFGTLIALAHRGRPVLGVIDQAIVGDRWIGADGHGTRLNGEVLRVRPCATIAEAIVSTSGPGDYAKEVDAELARVRRGARWLHFGADCVNYGLVATGLMDVVADAGLDAHDFAALDAVVRNAGGRFTDWSGQAITLKSDGRVLATGDARVHDEALERIADRAG